MNLKMLFGVIFLLADCALALLGFRAMTKKTPFAKPIVKIYATGFVTLAFYTMYLFSDNFLLMKIGNNISTAFLDWVLYHMMAFLLQYMGKTFIYNRIMRFMPVILSFDLLSFIVSCHNDFAVSYYVVERLDTVFVARDYNIPYRIHAAICYTMVVVIFALLIYQCAHVAKVYRIRFYSILLAYSIVVALNAVFIIKSGGINFSYLLYAILAATINYVSFSQKSVAMTAQAKEFFLDEMNSPAIFFDYQGRLLFCNRRARGLFNIDPKWTEEAFLKKAKFINIENPKEDQILKTSIIEAEGVYYFNVRYNYLRDKKGRRIGTSYIFEDITDGEKAVREAEFFEKHDEMTGLYNRLYFYDYIDEHKDDEDQLMYCAIYNIDGLNKVNATYGMRVGDKAVRRIAWILQQYSGPNDTVIRMSGDEMLLIMTKITENRAMDVLRRIERRTEKIDIDDITIKTNYVYFTVRSVGEFELAYSKAKDVMRNGKKQF